MSTGLTIGLDCGLTVTKAVIFDETGRPKTIASARVGQQSPEPRWVERDVDELWEAGARAIREALKKADVEGADVVGVGVTAHGDGLYLVDAHGKPTRPGILSLDTRAHQVVERWEEDGTSAKALEVTGQAPYPASPAAILAWLVEYEPDVVERSSWALACKDVIKQRLTGEVSADPTEASTSFTDPQTQEYSEAAVEVYGLGDQGGLLAPIVGCCEVAGTVTDEAAAQTGLAAGTPVVSGLHDVDASAVGIGCFEPGQMALIAGTFCINEVIGAKPIKDERWLARNFVGKGRWQHMSLSPASAGNLEWYVGKLSPVEYERAEEAGVDPFGFVEPEIAQIENDDSRILFFPFLYGSPHGAAPSGTFVGIRGWHERGHMLRAVLEGVVFNHRTHVDWLRESFEVSEARLTGGATRSKRWSQMFADCLDLPVVLTDAAEAGALGAAMCAMVGAGVHDSLAAAQEACVRITDRLEPEAEGHRRMDEAYGRYQCVLEQLAPVWRELNDE